MPEPLRSTLNVDPGAEERRRVLRHLGDIDERLEQTNRFELDKRGVVRRGCDPRPADPVVLPFACVRRRQLGHGIVLTTPLLAGSLPNAASERRQRLALKC
jgi:hypothetical protein